MFLQNARLQTYPHKEIIDLFDEFPGKIYPWVGNFNEAPTGERYLTVTHNGVKEEGMECNGADEPSLAVPGFLHVRQRR